MTEDGYNGFTNFETWLLHTNITNTQERYNSLFDFVRSWKKQYAKEISTKWKPEDIRINLADDLKEYLEFYWVDEYNIYKIDDSWTLRDWNEINFYELADDYFNTEDR